MKIKDFVDFLENPSEGAAGYSIDSINDFLKEQGLPEISDDLKGGIIEMLKEGTFKQNPFEVIDKYLSGLASKNTPTFKKLFDWSQKMGKLSTLGIVCRY